MGIGVRVEIFNWTSRDEDLMKLMEFELKRICFAFPPFSVQQLI
jgi:hypothetical protein